MRVEFGLSNLVDQPVRSGLYRPHTDLGTAKLEAPSVDSKEKKMDRFCSASAAATALKGSGRLAHKSKDSPSILSRNVF